MIGIMSRVLQHSWYAIRARYFYVIFYQQKNNNLWIKVKYIISISREKLTLFNNSLIIKLSPKLFAQGDLEKSNLQAPNPQNHHKIEGSPTHQLLINL